MGVEEGEVSLRWLGSGVAGEQQGEEVVVERSSRGTGLPFQALEEAMKRKKEKLLFWQLFEGKNVLKAK